MKKLIVRSMMFLVLCFSVSMHAMNEQSVEKKSRVPGWDWAKEKVVEFDKKYQAKKESLKQSVLNSIQDIKGWSWNRTLDILSAIAIKNNVIIRVYDSTGSFLHEFQG